MISHQPGSLKHKSPYCPRPSQPMRSSTLYHVDLPSTNTLLPPSHCIHQTAETDVPGSTQPSTSAHEVLWTETPEPPLPLSSFSWKESQTKAFPERKMQQIKAIWTFLSFPPPLPLPPPKVIKYYKKDLAYYLVNDCAFVVSHGTQAGSRARLSVRTNEGRKQKNLKISQ